MTVEKTQIEQRWIDVETKLAFLESANDSLSDTILLQQQQIDLLEQRLERVSQRLVDSQTSDNVSGFTNAQHEVPPHY